MLKITLGHAGHNSRVELNGVDISGSLRSVVVRTSVDEPTQAVLEYSGAVIVEAEDGSVSFEQAEHFSTCDGCQKVLTGQEQPLRIVDVSHFGTTSRKYAAVKG